MGLPINSANINTFDYNVQYDLNMKRVTLTDVSSYVNASNVQGIVFKLISPSGIVYHNNTNYATPDISPNSPLPYAKSMPTFTGAVEYGVYTVLGHIKDGNGEIYQLSKTLNVCKPSQCKGATGSDSCVTIQKKVDCLTSALFYNDVTVYTYKGVEGVVTCKVNVTFPSSTGLDPIEDANIRRFSLSPIYNGTYNFTATNTATYHFNDGQSVTIVYKLDEDVRVDCSISLCELECSLAEYIDEYEAIKGTGGTKEKTIANNIVLLSIKLQQLRMAIECGNDVTALLTEVEAILGKKCSCDCGSVNPTGAQIPSGTYIQVVEGCGDINIETTMVGTALVFKVSDKTYTIDTNNTSGVIISMNEQGCTRTYSINVCPDNLTLCNGYYLQTINAEDITEDTKITFNSTNNVGDVLNHFNNQIENLREAVINYTQVLNWITVTNSELQDFWQNHIQVQYAKDILGFVHLRGTIKNITVSNLSGILTMPSGYVPESRTAITATVRDINKLNYLAGEIEINNKTGGITFTNNGTFSVEGYLSLDGITYYAGFY